MWQNELKESLRTPEALLAYCGLSDVVHDIDASPEFKVFVPPRYLSKITKNNPLDPLLLQVLSDKKELEKYPLENIDPLEEKKYMPLEGLLHKYTHRVLIVTAAACPIHCRYCFRRHFPYEKSMSHGKQWEAIIDYIKGNNEINEVILSGGDPLMLGDTRLEQIFKDLSGCPSLRRIRIHTRFATTIPSRFSKVLWRLLAQYADKIIWVWHINHPQELGEDVKSIAKKAGRLGMRVLSQSVLLKGINDTVEILENLMWALDSHGIQPYYLHQIDAVQGGCHYEVDMRHGLMLMDILRTKLPGYLMPQYVKELAGYASKQPLSQELVDELM